MWDTLPRLMLCTLQQDHGLTVARATAATLRSTLFLYLPSAQTGIHTTHVTSVQPGTYADGSTITPQSQLTVLRTAKKYGRQSARFRPQQLGISRPTSHHNSVLFPDIHPFSVTLLPPGHTLRLVARRRTVHLVSDQLCNHRFGPPAARWNSRSKVARSQEFTCPENLTSV